jgi:hypothetical protein
MTNQQSSQSNPADQTPPKPAEVAPATDRPAAEPAKAPAEAPPVKS